VIIDCDAEGYFVASVPELRGCHTQAKSLYVLMKRIQEAIELCLEVDGEEISPQEFIGIQRLWVEV
jgi:predicted RNase H-like HicB family nuclease